MRVFVPAVLTVCAIYCAVVLNQVDKVAFSGEIRVQGRPLESGLILAWPEKGTDAGQVQARVKFGKFYVERENGLRPGNYRIEIVEFDGRRVTEAIPDKFNLNTILRLTVRPEDRCHAMFDL